MSRSGKTRGATDAAGLSSRERVLLIARRAGMSREHLARALRVSVDTVNRIHASARRKLRDIAGKLREAGDDADKLEQLLAGRRRAGRPGGVGQATRRK